jgi:hypothetical protein
MEREEPSNVWEQLRRLIQDAATWIKEHEAEIRAFGTWATIHRAGTKARLYIPRHPEAWREIEKARESADEESELDYETLILSLYAPGGLGFEKLRQELRDATLLSDRQQEVGEVLDSLVDNRYYVAVCGALPLVEFVLSKPGGKWNDPPKHLADLEKRLDEPLSSEVELDLLVEATALEMVQSEIPAIWKAGRHTVGAITDELNRHLALHGTALGWNDSKNATRAVLLLAAAARVADALSRPSSSAT